MSAAVLEVVRRCSRASGKALQTLLAMAECASSSGVVWGGGLVVVADRAGQTPDEARIYIKQLRLAGEVQEEAREGELCWVITCAVDHV